MSHFRTFAETVRKYQGVCIAIALVLIFVLLREEDNFQKRMITELLERQHPDLLSVQPAASHSVLQATAQPPSSSSAIQTRHVQPTIRTLQPVLQPAKNLPMTATLRPVLQPAKNLPVTLPPTPLSGGDCRIGIVMFCVGNGCGEMWELSKKNKQAYAEYHGYDFIVEGQSVYKPEHKGLHYTWMSIPALQKHLHQYDWLVWMDTDAVIMDGKYRLEERFKFGDKYFVIAKDWNGINAGIFAIKNSPGGHGFLKKIMDKSKQPTYLRHPWREQFAMMNIIKERDVIPNIIIEPSMRRFNSYGNRAYYPNARIKQECLFQDGDFLVHFAGCHDDRNRNCITEFKSYYSRLKNGRPGGMEVPRKFECRQKNLISGRR